MTNSQVKRRRGPAPKPEDQKRKNRISIFLTDAEYAIAKQKAGDYGLPDYVRTCAIDGQFAPKAASIPKLNIEVWKKLGRCTNNLNQIAKHLNTFAQTDDIHLDLNDLRAALAAFRIALIEGPTR
jgi:hypothetical protein